MAWWAPTGTFGTLERLPRDQTLCAGPAEVCDFAGEQK